MRALRRRGCPVDYSLGNQTVTVDHGLRAGSACAVAKERLEKGEAALDYITLLPLYLRAPQAERERAAREGAQHG